jgi:small subunit ribosomal protein S6
MMIFDPSLGDDKINAVATKVADKIKSLGGEVEKMDKWGVRKLASNMSNAPKLHSGYYIVAYFKAPTSVPPQLQKFLKVEEAIVRYGLVRAEEKPPEAISGKPVKTEEKIEAVVVGEIQEGTGEDLGGI